MTTDITTDGTNKVRDLTDLLKLDTYKEMTDDEINVIISYREELARKDEITKVQIQNHMVNLNAAADEYVRVATETNTILKQILNKELKLGTIEDTDATGVNHNE